MHKKTVDFLRGFPIEFYLLIVLPCIGIFTMLFLDTSSFSLRTLLFYLFFGGPFLLTAGGVLAIYFVSRIFFILLSHIMFTKQSFDAELRKIWQLIKSQLYLSLIFACGLLWINFLANYLSLSKSSEVITLATHTITHYDYVIFGKDLYFWLSHAVNTTGGPALSFILITSYKLLSFIVPLVLLVAVLSNKQIARKFIIFFFLVQFLGMPIWFALPALDPGTMYVKNILEVEPPARIGAELKSYQPDTFLASFQQAYFKNYASNKNYLALTAFPSMHTAWGLGAVLYGFEIFWLLGFLLVPWFLLEITGAVYLGQHYALDIVLGVVIAIIAYYLINLFFILEKKYYTKDRSLMIIDHIQNDVKLFWQALKKFPFPF